MPTSSDKTVLLCNCCASDIISSTTVNKIKSAIKNSDWTLIDIPELCESAAKKRQTLKKLSTVSNLTVIACYPRTVQWLFHLAGITLDTEQTTFFNMREQSVEEILGGLGLKAENYSSESECNIKNKINWVPWFPVIDYSRCVNCGQCMDFCLFGVYERIPDGSVRVMNPEKCKNNCPACARICPEIAIIFPKVPDSPINGANITPEDENNNKLRLDLNKLADNDPYAILSLRRNRAKSKLLRKQNSDTNDQTDRAD